MKLHTQAWTVFINSMLHYKRKVSDLSWTYFMERSSFFINQQMKQQNSSKSGGQMSFGLVFFFPIPNSLTWLCSYKYIHFVICFHGLQFVHLMWNLTRTGQVAKADLAVVKTGEELADNARAEPCLPPPQCCNLHSFRGAGYGQEERQTPRDTLSHHSQFADIKQLHGVVVLTLSHVLLS